VCGHVYCNLCLNAKLPDSSRKYTCPKCKTKLKRDTFFHTGYEDDKSFEEREKEEKKVYKVFDYTREDFDNLQNYNFFLEYRDTLVFNLITKNDVYAQREKINEHKQLRTKKGITKKGKINPEEERKNKQRYIIEEYKRNRTRMERREKLTSKRLNGTISVENCQIEGTRIEQEDLFISQKERGVFLRNTKPTDAISEESYRPSTINLFQDSKPVPVNVEQANISIKQTSAGPNADLENWNKLSEEDKTKAKIAGGFPDSLFLEKAKFEAFWDLNK